MARSARRQQQRFRSGHDNDIPWHSPHNLPYTTAMFCSTIGLVLLILRMTSSPSTQASVRTFSDPTAIPTAILAQLDAIYVLGGGAPTDANMPPVYVQRRCDDAIAVLKQRQQALKRPSTAKVFVTHKHNRRVQRERRRTSSSAYTFDAAAAPIILCLSAGTAHVPQRMSSNGLPVWESTASAGYLHQQLAAAAAVDIMAGQVWVETTSYDTIGNAYYSRTGFADVQRWQHILIITSAFHMPRTLAIFDWVYGVSDQVGYKLYYLSSPDVGLNDDALTARRHKEAQSLQTVQQHAQKYTTLADVGRFLSIEHALYSAHGLLERAAAHSQNTAAGVDEQVRKSYGGNRRRRRLSWLGAFMSGYM